MMMEEDRDDSIAIVFPDNGAYKRFKSKFQKFSQVICEKKRVGNDRIVHIVEGSAEAGTAPSLMTWFKLVGRF